MYFWRKNYKLIFQRVSSTCIKNQVYEILDEILSDFAEWLERLTVNAIGATVLGSIPASSGTVESEGRQIKQCWISYIKKIKKSPCKNQIH
jgi:hypothetical protein